MRLIDCVYSPTSLISTEAHSYGESNIKIGEHSRIDHGCILIGDILIGDYVHIAPYCVLYGKSGIQIDSYSGVGAFSVLHSEADDYSGVSICSPLVQEWMRKPAKGKITMKRLSNLGTRCTVLPGVTLNVGAAVGAHSLVKSDCGAWGIYAGTPARWLKTRDLACEGLSYQNDGYSYGAMG